MTRTVTVEEIKAEHADLWEFEYDGVVYERSTKLRTSLKRILGCTVHVAWQQKRNPVGFKGNVMDLSGTPILFINADDNLVYLKNSEWCFAGLL